MKTAANLIKLAADADNLQYVRAMHLAEANVEVHYSKDSRPLLIYNGRSLVSPMETPTFGVDVVQVELYLLVKRPKKDMRAEDIDDLHNECKSYVQSVFSYLQNNAAQNVEPYTLEPVYEFTDMYEGYKFNLNLPLYNDGC